MSVRWIVAVFGFAMLVAPQSDVLRLYLARHGQTDWNRDGRLQGSADIALNDSGRRQAAALAERLRGVRFDAVYSSALKRSRETADIVHSGWPVVALGGLNERRLGAFEGRPSSPEYERRSQIPDDTLDGGESLSQFFARIQTAVAALLQRHRAGAILIVGHGATNQMIVRALFGLSAEKASTFQQANDELYLCEIASGTALRFWKLTSIGADAPADSQATSRAMGFGGGGGRVIGHHQR